MPGRQQAVARTGRAGARHRYSRAAWQHPDRPARLWFGVTVTWLVAAPRLGSSKNGQRLKRYTARHNVGGWASWLSYPSRCVRSCQAHLRSADDVMIAIDGHAFAPPPGNPAWRHRELRAGCFSRSCSAFCFLPARRTPRSAAACRFTCDQYRADRDGHPTRRPSQPWRTVDVILALATTSIFWRRASRRRRCTAGRR